MQQNYGSAIAGGIQLEHQAMAAILHALKELLLFVSRAGRAPNLQPTLGCSLLLVTALCGPPVRLLWWCWAQLGHSPSSYYSHLKHTRRCWYNNSRADNSC